MADQVAVPAPAVEPAGPLQRGGGVKGQYVYWITMPNPLPETVASCGVKKLGKPYKKVGIEALRLLHGSPGLPGPPRLTKTRVSGLQCPPLGEPDPFEQANDSKYLFRAGSCCGFTPTTTSFAHTILQNLLFLHRKVSIRMRVVVRVVVSFKKEKNLFSF